MYECDPDWAPSLHMGHTQVRPSVISVRFDRRKKRERAAGLRNTGPSTAADVEMDGTEEVDDEAQPTDGAAQVHMDAAPLPGLVAPLCAEINRLSEENKTLKEKLSQMQITGEEQECTFCGRRRDEINRLLEENRTLTEKASERQMDCKFLENNDRKVLYYTGLPSFVLLSAVLTHVMPLLPQTGHKLSPFQMVILTLMRLRLNLPRRHLAHIFCVCVSTVSNVFLNTISVMYTQLQPFVFWPEREALHLTMPHQFVEAFGKKVAVIIDCFEIWIERPSNHKAKAETFSYYKHANTVKYLIGITPNGAISFISNGFGGRATDKKVTEDCGIIDKLYKK